MMQEVAKQMERIEKNQHYIMNQIHWIHSYLQFQPPYSHAPSFPTSSPEMFQTTATVNSIPSINQLTSQNSTEIQFSASTTASPLPINVHAGNNFLESCHIEKSKLSSVKSIIEKYHNMKSESKAPTLAWRIAREAVFGDYVLKQCTPLGSRDLPGLPLAELKEIKNIIFNLFPQYSNSQHEFESLWKKCIESIQQGCKRLRAAHKNI